MPSSVIGAVGSIAGGLIGSKSSSKAASAQVAAGDKAAEVQKYMYDTSRDDLAPYRTAGSSANNALSYLMGISTFDRKTIADQLLKSNPSLSKFTDAENAAILKEIGMPTGTKDYNAWLKANPSKITQYNALRKAYGDNVQIPTTTSRPPTTQAPSSQWVPEQPNIGLPIQPPAPAATTPTTAALDPRNTIALEAAIDAEIARLKKDPSYGSLAKKFSLSDYIADPGYKFRLDEGNKAINRTQSARGNFYSGAALKEANRYNSDMASQEYDRAYGRFNTDQGNLYSRLGGIANTGFGATNTAVGANQNNANALGNIYGQVGNAQAANSLNQGNIWQGALSGILGKSQYTLPTNSGPFNPKAYSNGLPWSDRELKRDIKLVGREHGFNIYEFRYKHQPDELWRGVIAQEVEEIMPEAVVEIGGYKAVNYPMIGIEFMRAV